ncbi:MAG: hypothetical protein M3Q71_02260 [Chloroflexota bacterium]|nr:hypothetical protein [Chloroflexota bacterium]MDP9469477.1 hypothetical protein [Chloroflexota bacterium]
MSEQSGSRRERFVLVVYGMDCVPTVRWFAVAIAFWAVSRVMDVLLVWMALRL